MTQNGKRNYRIRYDRILFVGVILLILILLMTSCISSCGKKSPGGTSSDNSGSLDNQLSTDPSTGTPVPAVTQPATQAAQLTNVNMNTSDVHKGNLILVNNAHPCEFPTGTAAEGSVSGVDFVTIRSVLTTKTESPWHYTAADWEVGLDRETAMAMDAWLEGFYSATGDRFVRMIGGYRSDASDADFRTGRTCLLGIYPDSGSSGYYKAEGNYSWLAEHAAEFGFILRYPEDKDGFFDEEITTHRTATFRYVGIPAATYISGQDLCLEEFLEDIKTFSVDSMLEVTCGEAVYGMYYVPASNGTTTAFDVPAAEGSYWVSGNNMDGFVITVLKSGTPSQSFAGTPAAGDTTEPASDTETDATTETSQESLE